MPRNQRAFTLMEMLVVISLITLLLALIQPSLNRSREYGRRALCASNQRQLMSGLISYADGNPQGIFLPTANYTIDDISMVVPDYVPDRRIAICPDTKHRAENLTFSYGSPGPSAGFSYEMFSWIGRATYPTGEHYDFEWIKTSNARRPSELWIPMDDSSGHGDNNWPNPGNNHGAEGVNLGFIDGHAGWHSRHDYVIAAIDSYHPWFGNNATTLYLAQSEVPYVGNTGGWHGTWWYNN